MNVKLLLGATGLVLVAFFFLRAQEKMVTVQEPDFPTEVVQIQNAAQDVHFDISKKAAHVMAELKRAAAYFDKHTLVETCKVLSHGTEFSGTDVYVFLMDMNGRFIAHEQSQLIWKDYYN